MSKKKVVQFVMLDQPGNSPGDYVANVMDDDNIRENIMRNVRGAADIDGRVRLIFSSRQSREVFLGRLRQIDPDNYDNNRSVIEIVSADKLTKKFLQDGLGLSHFQEQKDEYQRSYDMLMQRKGSFTVGEFMNYVDVIKLLGIYYCEPGQLVESADLDQQIDITKAPNLGDKVKKVGLYTSMHLGKYPGDESYRRHDMSKKKLLAYHEEHKTDHENRPYTNERSYIIGFGGDKALLDVVKNFVNVNQHLFTLYDNYEAVASTGLGQGIYVNPMFAGSVNIIGKGGGKLKDPKADADIKPKDRQELIRKHHLGINSLSLLPGERSQGRDVAFESFRQEKRDELRRLSTVDDNSVNYGLDLNWPTLDSRAIDPSQRQITGNNDSVTSWSPVDSNSQYLVPLMALGLVVTKFLLRNPSNSVEKA
ncbi:MAG: hypothetical protein ISQ34_00465 [Rickettsiales bacterium]|nr:hypothetical protein [Rickettsiales bacterium]